METTYTQINNKENIYHYLHFNDVAHKATEIIEQLHHKKQKAFVIIKGSQNTIFLEEVVKALLANNEDKKYLTRQ